MRKKRILRVSIISTVAVAIVMVTAAFVFAAEGTFGDGFTWSFEDGVLTIEGEGAMPDYNGGETKKPWRDYEEQIQKVVIGEGITDTGSEWFAYDKSITEVQLPSTLKRIGYYCFNQIGAREIVIPEGVEELGEGAFLFCGLERVQLPSTLKVIGDSAFFCNNSLTEIQLPDGLEKIDDQAFVDTPLETVRIPGSVKYIGLGAFYDSQLTSVEGLDQVEFVGFHAFEPDVMEPYVREENNMKIVGGTLMEYQYANSETAVNVPDGIVAIGDYAFANYELVEQWDRPLAEVRTNKVLEKVVLPESVKYIGEGAFDKCTRLTGINTEKVSFIDEDAFEECTHLTKMDISSAEYLGRTMFFRCLRLESVEYSKVSREIPINMFLQCGKLKTIHFPNPIDAIGESAFTECTHLTTFPTLSNKLTIIPEDAFRFCYQLKKINIPNSVQRIEGGAFEFCKRLTNITIPAGVKKIESDAFDSGYLKRIKGYSNSAAQKYAKKKRIKFTNLEYSKRAIITPQKTYKVLKADGKFSLGAMATDGWTLKYRASNKKIKVSSKGVVTPKKKGTAYITIFEAKNINGKALKKKVKIVIQ